MQEEPAVHLPPRDAEERELRFEFEGQIDHLLYFIRPDALLFRYPRVRLRESLLYFKLRAVSRRQLSTSCCISTRTCNGACISLLAQSVVSDSCPFHGE